MTNNLILQFKRDMESFGEDFGQFINTDPEAGKSSLQVDIEKHHTQSLLNLLTKIIEERERKMVKLCECVIPKPNINRCQNCKLVIRDMRGSGYSLALSDTISQLQEFKNYLLEELKK